MWKVVLRSSVLAIGLLAGALASALTAQVSPETSPPSQYVPRFDLEPWPETLQVYPSHPGDPVELVRITKDGQEVVPGSYALPRIAGDIFQDEHAVKDWLNGASCKGTSACRLNK